MERLGRQIRLNRSKLQDVRIPSRGLMTWRIPSVRGCICVVGFRDGRPVLSVHPDNSDSVFGKRACLADTGAAQDVSGEGHGRSAMLF